MLGKRFTKDLRNKIGMPDQIPVKFYSKQANVGDLLNEYLLQKICGKEIYRCRSQAFRHLVAVGSVLEYAGPRSLIWGSGSINGQGPKRKLRPDYIFALRGEKTQEVVEKICNQSLTVPLGDPGLLMPRFYNPDVVSEKKIGIVFHHSESDLRQKVKDALPDDCLIIDVTLRPEEFVRQIKKCEAILSSSLHGLILADVYGIPNKWLSVSDRLLGGTWKFHDYYSTTSTPDEIAFESKDPSLFLNKLTKMIDCATVSDYLGSKDKLLAAFPKVFL